MCYSIMVEQDVNKLAEFFGAMIDQSAFQRYNEYSLQDPKAFKRLKDNPRIYPNYWAPVILQQDGKRIIRPMRYRVRPHGSTEEVPSRYNVFNCRLDSLEMRQTWKQLFMHKHALIPFLSFYEWVTDKETGKKIVVNFSPGGRQLMWAPALYDNWDSQDGTLHIDSFALITGEPPAEVAAAGHDRCPIFIKKQLIESWLTPAKQSKKHIYEILHDIEDVTFQCAKAV